MTAVGALVRPLRMSSKISAISTNGGGTDSRRVIIIPASAFRKIAPSGWASSWAIDPDSCPIALRAFECREVRQIRVVGARASLA